jgi:hypothetical protein
MKKEWERKGNKKCRREMGIKFNPMEKEIFLNTQNRSRNSYKFILNFINVSTKCNLLVLFLFFEYSIKIIIHYFIFCLNLNFTTFSLNLVLCTCLYIALNVLRCTAIQLNISLAPVWRTVIFMFIFRLK